MTKEEKKALRAKKKAESKGLVAEFKAFIARGNVLDMAVGVIIGAAFNAIVTAFVNILMSICTWRLPGGIKGLVTILPAANDVQSGLDPNVRVFGEGGKVVASLGQEFQSGQLQALAKELAYKNYAEQIELNPDYITQNPNLIESTKTTILGKYTLHGTKYVYNLSAIIDWGTLINAVISFLIIAVTLFVIIKAANKMNKIRTDIQAKAKPAEEAEAAPAE